MNGIEDQINALEWKQCYLMSGVVLLMTPPSLHRHNKHLRWIRKLVGLAKTGDPNYEGVAVEWRPVPENADTMGAAEAAVEVPSLMLHSTTTRMLAPTEKVEQCSLLVPLYGTFSDILEPLQPPTEETAAPFDPTESPVAKETTRDEEPPPPTSTDTPASTAPSDFVSSAFITTIFDVAVRSIISRH